MLHICKHRRPEVTNEGVALKGWRRISAAPGPLDRVPPPRVDVFAGLGDRWSTLSFPCDSLGQPHNQNSLS